MSQQVKEHERLRAEELRQNRILLYEALIACEGDAEVQFALGIPLTTLQKRLEDLGLDTMNVVQAPGKNWFPDMVKAVTRIYENSQY